MREWCGEVSGGIVLFAGLCFGGINDFEAARWSRSSGRANKQKREDSRSSRNRPGWRTDQPAYGLRRVHVKASIPKSKKLVIEDCDASGCSGAHVMETRRTRPYVLIKGMVVKWERRQRSNHWFDSLYDACIGSVALGMP